LLAEPQNFNVAADHRKLGERQPCVVDGKGVRAVRQKEAETLHGTEECRNVDQSGAALQKRRRYERSGNEPRFERKARKR
jgi:hypothetical protein